MDPCQGNVSLSSRGNFCINEAEFRSGLKGCEDEVSGESATFFNVPHHLFLKCNCPSLSLD